MPEGELTSLVAVFFGLWVAFHYTPLIVRRKGNVDRRVIVLCGIGWTIALASFFLLTKVWQFIGEVTRIPSLAWLLSFLALTVCYHYILEMCFIALGIERSQTKMLEYVAVTFMASLTLVFFVGGVAFSRLPLERIVPRYLGELVYMGLLHGYSIAIFAGPVIAAVRMALSSPTMEMRVRSLILVASCISAIVFSITVIALGCWSVFIGLPSESIPQLKEAALLFFSITILAWPFAFMPSKWLGLPRRLWQLHHLVYLDRRIKSVNNHPLVGIPRLWWTRIAELDFYIDAVSVLVLDTKWLIKADRLTVKDSRVLDVMNALDETLPREQLIGECINLSKHLKRLDRLPGESVF